MKEEVINSLSEYADIISLTTQEGYSFFRGQASVSYKLLPSLLRTDESGNRFYGDNCDKSFINAFKTRSIPYLQKVPSNEWEWLLTAQHYGVPTRLLDWTQGPLVALFFAVENINVGDLEYPVVWALNPSVLNLKGPFQRDNDEIPNLMEDNSFLHFCLDEYYQLGRKREDYIYPLAIVGPQSNNRIKVQKGVFTLFPMNAKPLEDMEEAERFLYKIIVNSEKKQDIRKQLFELGITYSNIYPELEYVSKDILFEYSI